jgi:hypothetical protein
MIGHFGDGLLPRDRFPFPFPSLTSAPHGALDSVEIIEYLKGSLGPRADLALAEWMARVALDFDRSSINDSYQCTTAGRTNAADSWHLVVLGNSCAWGGGRYPDVGEWLSDTA